MTDWHSYCIILGLKISLLCVGGTDNIKYKNTWEVQILTETDKKDDTAIRDGLYKKEKKLTYYIDLVYTTPYLCYKRHNTVLRQISKTF